MNTIDEIVQHIEEAFGGVVVTARPFKPLPRDIDIYVPRDTYRGLKEYLESLGFACTEDSYKCQARKFIGGECYFLDISFDIRHLARFFHRTRFTAALSRAMQYDSKLESFIKHIFGLNGDERAVRFVASVYDTYRPYLFDAQYIQNGPFRKTLSVHGLSGIMELRITDVMRSLTLGAIVDLVTGKLMSFLGRIGRGKIIAFVGPDGSGKSTVIESVRSALFAKQMYMGDWDFMLQPFYNVLYTQHIAIARLVYPFFYVENWIRYMRAFLLKMFGEIVLVDRYPGLNRALRKDSVWLRLNDLLYHFFPQADGYVFISAPPETVYARRQELSVEEITLTQVNIRTRLRGKKYIEIQNLDLDSCLNETLSYILAK